LCMKKKPRWVSKMRGKTFHKGRTGGKLAAPPPGDATRRHKHLACWVQNKTRFERLGSNSGEKTIPEERSGRKQNAGDPIRIAKPRGGGESGRKGHKVFQETCPVHVIGKERTTTMQGEVENPRTVERSWGQTIRMGKKNAH